MKSVAIIGAGIGGLCNIKPGSVRMLQTRVLPQNTPPSEKQDIYSMWCVYQWKLFEWNREAAPNRLN